MALMKQYNAAKSDADKAERAMAAARRALLAAFEAWFVAEGALLAEVCCCTANDSVMHILLSPQELSACFRLFRY